MLGATAVIVFEFHDPFTTFKWDFSVVALQYGGWNSYNMVVSLWHGNTRFITSHDNTEGRNIEGGSPDDSRI